jgi:surface antigen Omp85-like protein
VTILGALAFAITAAGAQLPSDTTTPPAIVQVPDSGKFKLTPVLAPAYNPEMEFLVVGGALISWKVGPNPLLVQRSTLTTTVSYSTIGALNLNATLTSFWLDDRLRISADFALKDMPDNYWGVGYDAGLAPTRGDSTTSYHREWFKISPRITWKVGENLFVGGTFDLNRTIASDVNPFMAADPAFQHYGSENANLGLGGVVQYDSRDVTANAWRGVYLSLTATSYGGFLGGDNDFQIYLLDYRQYVTLKRPGRTLAWQLKARIGAHGVPWSEMSVLGAGSDLRAYIEGRFRDRATISGLVEYRYMFSRTGRRLSRHGVVVWTGAGSLGSDLATLHGLVPAVGFGYRFELQPRANVRMDIGFGKHSSGIYFNFTEAF